MIQNIQIAHNRKSTVVLTRVYPDGHVRQRAYYRASAASLQRLQRLAKTNRFSRLPRKWRNPDWWQRESAST